MTVSQLQLLLFIVVREVMKLFRQKKCTLKSIIILLYNAISFSHITLVKINTNSNKVVCQMKGNQCQIAIQIIYYDAGHLGCMNKFNILKNCSKILLRELSETIFLLSFWKTQYFINNWAFLIKIKPDTKIFSIRFFMEVCWVDLELFCV